MKTINALSGLVLLALLLVGSLCFADNHASVVQVVKQAQTTVSVATTNSPVLVGAPVAINANIGSQAAIQTVPTGTVQFTATGTKSGSVIFSGKVPLNAGRVSWNASFNKADTYSVVGAYSGDTNFASSVSSAAQQVVAEPGAPDFQINLPSSITVAEGSSVSTPVSVTPFNDFTGTITFTCSGAPEASTCSFGNGSVVIPAVAAASQGSATTSFTVTTTGTTVVTASSFLILLGLRRRRRRSHLIALLLCLLGLLYLNGCGSPNNRYVQKNGTPLGSYPLTITAKSGSVVHTAQITLNVVAPK